MYQKKINYKSKLINSKIQTRSLIITCINFLIYLKQKTEIIKKKKKKKKKRTSRTTVEMDLKIFNVTMKL